MCDRWPVACGPWSEIWVARVRRLYKMLALFNPTRLTPTPSVTSWTALRVSPRRYSVLTPSTLKLRPVTGHHLSAVYVVCPCRSPMCWLLSRRAREERRPVLMPPRLSAASLVTLTPPSCLRRHERSTPRQRVTRLLCTGLSFTSEFLLSH